MKVYSKYSGEVPSGVVAAIEGSITRIYFDYELITQTVDDEPVEMLVCENVDVKGALDYGKIVSAVVRDKYPQDSVEAILANGTDTPEHQAEFDAFQAWREKAKQIAHSVINELT